MAERWKVTRCRCGGADCRQWVVLDPSGRKVWRVPTLVLAYGLASLEAGGSLALAVDFGARVGASALGGRYA